MSAAIAAAPAARTELHTARPSFLGIVRGELYKVSRQRATWVMAVLLLAILFLPYLIINVASASVKASLLQTPLVGLYSLMESGLSVLRIFSGTFLILVTARLIGMEYSGGTIRVLLARGVGRLQLLAAKLTTAALVALVVLVVGLAVNLAMSLITVAALTGNLDALKAADATFWSDTRVYVVTVAISMAVSILMATAVTVISRSLAAGLAIGVSFFAADNIGVIFFFLAAKLTGADFWNLATGDLLGPNLNAMPNAVMSSQAPPFEALQTPLVPVSGGHTLVVTLIWTLAFAASALFLTWRRDVLE